MWIWCAGSLVSRIILCKPKSTVAINTQRQKFETKINWVKIWKEKERYWCEILLRSLVKPVIIAEYHGIYFMPVKMYCKRFSEHMLIRAMDVAQKFIANWVIGDYIFSSLVSARWEAERLHTTRCFLAWTFFFFEDNRDFQTIS